MATGLSDITPAQSYPEWENAAQFVAPEEIDPMYGQFPGESDPDGWPGYGALISALERELTTVELPSLNELDDSRIVRIGQHARDIIGELEVAIDRTVGAQLGLVLGHPLFRRLEATWRGIAHVVKVAGSTCSTPDELENFQRNRLEVQLANYGPDDIASDFSPLNPTHKTWLYERVYTEALNTRGGHPFGIIVSGVEFGGDTDTSQGALDYSEFNRWGDKLGGIDYLARMADVGERAFCPIVASASPGLLRQRDFSHLPRPDDLLVDQSTGAGAEWAKLRKRDCSRYVGLTVPRAVFRPPLSRAVAHRNWFDWPPIGWMNSVAEMRQPLLGSAAYVLAGVVARSMLSGWPSNIQGVPVTAKQNGYLAVGRKGGVAELRDHDFETDPTGVCPRAPVEMNLSVHERRLSELGFIVLTRVPMTGLAAFYSLRMAHMPEIREADSHTDPTRDNATQELHSLLPYLLTASRFAHLAKIFARHEHGRLIRDSQARNDLMEILNQYQSDAANSGKPLRRSNVSVQSLPGGIQQCVLEISPRLLVEGVEAVEVESVTVLAIESTQN